MEKLNMNRFQNAYSNMLYKKHVKFFNELEKSKQVISNTKIYNYDLIIKELENIEKLINKNKDKYDIVRTEKFKSFINILEKKIFFRFYEEYDNEYIYCFKIYKI